MPGVEGGGPDVGGREEEARTRGLRRWGSLLAQLLLTAVVTWFIVDRVGLTVEDVAGLDRRWLRPNWALFVLSAVLLLLGFLASSLLWGRMVEVLGGPRLGRIEACRIYFTANLGRYVPGKVWQLAGLAYLARDAGVAVSTATAAAVLVQATSLGGATLVGAGALVGPARPWSGWGPWAAGFLVLALGVALLPPVFRRGMALWFRLAGREAPDAFRPDATFGLRWIGLFAGNWILYGGAFWLLASSFGVGEPFVVLAPAFAAAYVLGYLMIFAPAGLGVREGFLIAFLEPGLGAGAAAALAVVARLWITALELIPALGFAGRTLGRTAAGKGEGAP